MVTATTRETYAAIIAEFGRALRLLRAIEVTGAGKPTMSNTPPARSPTGVPSRFTTDEQNEASEPT